ncbi:MAG TPA: M28 family peptidase [Anaerolineales bacterium]|nr:M28 family peptidase [Anaerolineales bacterium]
MKNKILFPALAVCLLGGAISLTMTLISPTAPLPTDAPVTEFSAGRAMQHLEIIARDPRPTGEFPARTAVRNYLLGEIRNLGLQPQVQDTFGLRLWGPDSGYVSGGFVENILVRLPGSQSDGAILLIGHYDSTPGGPGAADNGSGVVILLELLRALQTGSPLRQDVIFLFTDGEEPGCLGTYAFVAQHSWFEDIRRVINVDTIRDGSPGLVQTIQENGIWVQALARTAQSPAYLSLPLHLFPASDSDLVPFESTGIPGVSFGTNISQEVHTALDRPEIVNPGSLQLAGDHILALVRYLGDQPMQEIDAPNQTFFPVLGRLVHYPVTWAIPLAILAGLCLLGTFVYGFYQKKLTWKGTGSGFLTLLLCLALSLGITILFWQGIQVLHPEYQYSGVRTHLSDDYLYALGFFVLALTITTGLVAMVRQKVFALDLAAGALTFWLPTGLAAAILVPGISYLATWTLLIGSLALLLALAVQSSKHSEIISELGFLASAILATFLWLPTVAIAFIALGFTMPWLVTGVATLWLAAMLPTLDRLTSPKRWLLPAAASLVSLGLLLAGHILVGKHSPPPLVNSIGYWLDSKDNRAYWVAFIGGHRTDARTMSRIEVAFPEAMDERQNQLLLDPIRRDYKELFAEAPGFSVLTSEAPLLVHTGPSLDVISDRWINNRRVMRVRFTASLQDRLYIVIPNTPLQGIKVPHNARAELSGNTGWWLRFDGIPGAGLEMSFEFGSADQIQFLLVEEKTGLPSFPGLMTQPEPGTMRSPGLFLQGDATDFTALHRSFEIPSMAGK